MTAAVSVAQSGTSNTTFRNRIINGAMVIDQRNAGASITPTAGQYSVDRWSCTLSQASKYSAQQNAGSVTPPTGFKNYLGVTSLSAYSIVTGDYFNVSQAIEGLNVSDLSWGTASAAPVTLSFVVRSSLTGTFGGVLQNSALDRSYPFTFTISSANTWEQKSVTIAGDTSGTWLTTNGIGVYVRFGLGVGATYSGTAGAWAGANYASATGATSVVGTNGATFYVTGVQLEKGTTATPFEQRLYGIELALCQRYYYRLQGEAGNGYQGIAIGGASSATQVNIDIKHPVQMRTTPTAAFGGTITLYDGGATPALTSIGASYLGPSTGLFQFIASGGGMTLGRAVSVYTQNATTNYMDFSAEL